MLLRQEGSDTIYEIYGFCDGAIGRSRVKMLHNKNTTVRMDVISKLTMECQCLVDFLCVITCVLWGNGKFRDSQIGSFILVESNAWRAQFSMISTFRQTSSQKIDWLRWLHVESWLLVCTNNANHWNFLVERTAYRHVSYHGDLRSSIWIEDSRAIKEVIVCKAMESTCVRLPICWAVSFDVSFGHPLFLQQWPQHNMRDPWDRRP